MEKMYVNDKLVRFFTSRFITMNQRNYEIISTEKLKNGTFIHTVKNDKNEYRDFEHEKLCNLIEKSTQ